MFSFDMTAEQKMLVETVHRYAEQELRTTYRAAEEANQVSDEVVQTGWALGLLPGSIDPQYGGFGNHSALTSALYLEELGWGDVATSLHLLTPNLFAIPISLFGTPAQKETYLERFCAESFAKATAAFTEPVLQFDAAEMATTAELVGDNYIIQGRKTFVPLAADAELFLVYARERGSTQAFIVPSDTGNIHVEGRVKMMGAQSLAVYNVQFDNVSIPKINRLGGPRGVRLNRLMTVARISLAALAIGQARAAYEYALQYAKEREAFGEPIAHRQSIAFMLANMAIEIESTRLMVWEAAYKFDNNEDATNAAALAKQYADKMVLTVTDNALQVLGGHGYIRDHPVELWLRNGRGFAAWDGLVIA